MQRYFVKNFDESQFIIEKEDHHHMKKVMRMHDGDEIVCINEKQQVFLCRIMNIEIGRIEVMEELMQDCELPVKVNLIYALPKSDKFEFVLQKACELGVTCIIPLLSKRCIVKTDRETFNKKYQRFNKILKEAAEQSYRNQIPKIAPLIKLSEVASYLGDHNLVAYEENAKQNEMSRLKEVLSQVHNGDTITIIVGCEGGFEQSEIDELEKMGVVPCSLGKRILRSETAPLYLLSAIGYALELG
ncbi:MAG: RsmE family RNA methyltransferase [Beduini sp.]|uniref:RsmE family RNA methyltransferase n=1 Tax=Beduini sp. TaxID=1922300 RepID=UPI0039A226EF